MMMQSELSKEQLQYCAEEIKSELSPEIDYDREKMKKGLNLFRQGSVFNAEMTDRYIEARVQDVTPFDVMLDLDVFILSTCTCPAVGICRHKLAAFFYTYAMVGRVGDFFQEWKSERKPAPLLTRKKELPEEEIKTSVIGNTVRSWQAYFKKQYQVFKEKPRYDQYSFNQMYLFQSIYRTFFQQTLRLHAPVQPFTKELYMIHAAVFTMQRLVEESEQSRLSLSSKDSNVYPFVRELIDTIFSMIRDAKSLAVPLSADPLLIETKNEMNKFLFCGHEFQYDRMLAYFIVWGSLLNRNEWLDETRLELQKKQKAFLASKDAHAVDCQFGLAHFAYLQNQDDEAIRLVTQIQGNILDYCMYWTGDLAKMKEWTRQRKWLDSSLPLLKEYSSSMTDHYSKRSIVKRFLPFYMANADQTQNIPLYVDAMKAVLPYSYSEYNDYLVEVEDFETWTDLQMLVGYDIPEIGRSVIKHIENTNRMVLLPLYHKAVNQAIGQKNRSAYKDAVRYLKKLRAHYRQLKQLDHWNDYISRLALEHKRLRAFQEELERGKLLHD
ncbi:SWIM zinc finger family protein [Bacillus sp. DJP31]|uniref:SWIM zinc finger family protein n=1 Tax=Bacillus sp. DJP31 TaxID=3409789 RepID=UPI003BB5D869